MVPPPPLSPPLCTLPPGPGPPRFVCYCEGEGSEDGGRGGFNLYVTDAAELWSTCFTADSLEALKARLGLSAAEEITPRFRAACEQQAVTFALREDGASLTLSGGPWALDFELSKVPGPEAASRLRALTLGLAEQVCNLKRQLAGLQVTATSPKKSPCLAGPQFFLPGKACHLGLRWGLCSSSLCDSPSPEQESGPRDSMCTERGLWLWNSPDSGSPVPSCCPQTRTLREVALDLGSGGGVQESPSSTLASRVRNQPVV
ncbi:protein PAXX isoform X2 [Prionailurus bengalensis]|uniref:protein PAXX isoform X2 n=1 Tax=Prionailurus bengalensis TaxID=37029 RepID=UPI001CA97A33|nr:protein PAXX isoform X2 [Prionailurus bengalensis]